MKRTHVLALTRGALVSLILASATLADGADLSQARKHDQNTEQAKKTSTANATVPFDIDVERLPPKYQGHSILDIYKKLALPRPKGEFEKTEEYDARVIRWKKTTILGKITPTDVLAFEVAAFLAPDALSVSYDADSETLTATVSFEDRYFDSGKARWLETFYTSKNLGSYAAVTRMGVKFKVTGHLGTSLGLGIDEQIAPISISKSYARADAQRIKNSIRAYAIATLTEPYKIDSEASTTASLDKPDEWLNKYFGLWVSLKAIWFVNVATGEIIAKSEAPFLLCSYSVC